MRMKKSLSIYAGFLFITLLGIGIAQYTSFHLATPRIWSLENILWLCLGIPFVLLGEKVGLPAFSEPRISRKKRILEPVLIGLAFGITDLVLIEYVLTHPTHQSLPPYTQPFPYSLFLFFSGAFEIEVFYRLIPVTLLLFLAKRFANSKHQEGFFWGIALISSLREPLEQFPEGPLWFMVYSLVSGFAMNLVQVLYFKRYGFVASLLVRLSHYLIWHILNGIIIQFYLLNTTS